MAYFDYHNLCTTSYKNGDVKPSSFQVKSPEYVKILFVCLLANTIETSTHGNQPNLFSMEGDLNARKSA